MTALHIAVVMFFSIIAIEFAIGFTAGAFETIARRHRND